MNINLDHLLFPQTAIDEYDSTVKRYVYSIQEVNHYRAGSLLVNPNVFGTVILITIPVCFTRYMESNQKRYLVIIGMLYVSLLITLSRISIFSGVVQAAYLTYAYRKRITYYYMFNILLIGSSALVFLYLAFGGFDKFIELRVSGLGLGVRTEIAQYGLSVFASNLLFGIGANCSALLLDTTDFYYTIGNNFHNHWLIVLVELGIVGFSLELIFTIYILFSNGNSRYSILVKSSMCALLITSITNDSYNYYSVKLFIIIMVIIAHNYKSNHSKMNKQS